MALELGKKSDSNRRDMGLDGFKTLWKLTQTQGFLRSGRLSAKDRILFTEQLLLLVETGVSLHTALGLLVAQTGSPQMHRILDGMLSAVAAGKPFSGALEQFPQLFPKTYVNLVAAGERGGFLDRALSELLEMDQRELELKRSILSALSYPIFLIVMSMAVIVFVLTVVFPKFGDMFETIRDQLPLSTLVLMAISEILLRYWPLVVAGLVGTLVAISFWMNTVRGRGLVDRAKLSLVYVRDIYLQFYLSRTLRVMGLSLANGVNILDTLTACRELVRNQLFSAFIDRLQVSVKEGNGVAAAFEKESLIPLNVRQMVATGEETGNLGHVATRIADYFEADLKRRIGAFAKMIEPLMLLVMGVVVGLIVSSLILPIFKLSRAVG